MIVGFVVTLLRFVCCWLFVGCFVWWLLFTCFWLFCIVVLLCNLYGNSVVGFYWRDLELVLFCGDFGYLLFSLWFVWLLCLMLCELLFVIFSCVLLLVLWFGFGNSWSLLIVIWLLSLRCMFVLFGFGSLLDVFVCCFVFGL